MSIIKEIVIAIFIFIVFVIFGVYTNILTINMHRYNNMNYTVYNYIQHENKNPHPHQHHENTIKKYISKMEKKNEK